MDKYYLALDTEYVRKTSTQNQLLSWQACISLDGKKISKGYIRYIEKNESRPKLQEIILQAFHAEGVPLKNLQDRHIVIICHYCPAEISMLSDKIGEKKFQDIKFLTRNMEYVRKTVLTLNKPLKLSTTYIDENGEKQALNFSYEFFDTLLIAPAGASSLEKLSKALTDTSFHKQPLNPYEISHMDWVLKYKKQKFTQYALNDAKATLAIFLDLQNSFNKLEESDTFQIKKTIASAAVQYYQQYIKGIEKNLLKKILGKNSSLQTTTNEKFSECYHGGRNETYWIGKAPSDYLYLDLDFKNAYPTSLSMMHGIDWESTPRYITDIKQLLISDEQQLNATYVQANFSFPEGTLYPCLPDYHEEYGLLYPLQGTTYTTAHEIILAHKMGANIEILNAMEMTPLTRNGEIYYPFKDFYIKIIKERSKYPPKSMRNLLFKEYSNTLYGKICQNVAKKTSKGLYDDTSKELGPSPITSSAYAANVTGIMRAALGELLYTCTQLNEILGDKIYLPVNAVTDGAMIGIKKSCFSAETLEKLETKSYTNIKEIIPEFIEKLEESSLIRLLKKTRAEIANPKQGYLEIKSVSDTLWTFKTRGSVGYYKNKLTVLTKAGHKPPMIQDTYEEKMFVDGENKIYRDTYMRPRSDEESAQWLLEIYNSIPEIQIYPFARLITFKDLIYTSNDYEDMIQIIKERKTNLDFDYKRKPDFDNTPIDDKTEPPELIDINTLPFCDKYEMLKWREAANNLRNSGKKDQVGGKYAGYRATPIKVQQKVLSNDRYGAKGAKGVIVAYVVEAYIKNKLPLQPCDDTYAEIERKFIHPKFATKDKKKPFINRERIRNLVHKRFVPSKLADNNYTRYWVRQTLLQLDIISNDAILRALIAIKRS